MQKQTQITDQQPVNLPMQFSIIAVEKVLTHLHRLLAKTYPPKFKAGKKPTKEQIAKTRGMTAEVRSLLSPRVTPADVVRIFTLLSGGMAMNRDTDAAISAQSYTDALKSRSSWAVGEAYNLIITGEAKGMSLRFMPQAPELSQFCKDLEHSLLAKIDYIDGLFDAPEEEQ